jgi:hypothetical protein
VALRTGHLHGPTVPIRTAPTADEEAGAVQNRRVTQRLVTLDNLGAWLLKCNADASDIEQRSRRDPRVARWCVQPNYRTRLMRKGHKVIFWVSGSRRTLRPGIWGVGHLVGAPRGQDEEPPAGPVVRHRRAVGSRRGPCPMAACCCRVAARYRVWPPCTTVNMAAPEIDPGPPGSLGRSRTGRSRSLT